MPRRFARLSVPPLVIAFAATVAVVVRDDGPAVSADPSDALAPSVASTAGPLPDGFSLGPDGAAPELVVVDEPSAEEATPRPRSVAPPSTTPPTVETVPLVTLVASEALVFEEVSSSLPRQTRHPRGSIRIDPTLDTAGGGISTVADDGGRRGGIRIGITTGDGCRAPATSLVFDRGVGLSTGSFARF